MTHPNTDQGVTAEDREASIVVLKGMEVLGERNEADLRRGVLDYVGIVQAFARHRLSSTAALEAEIASLKQRLESAERHLSFWAKRPTIAEVIEGKCDRMPDTVEARIEEMGRRKREHDDAILAARTFLQEQEKQG